VEELHGGGVAAYLAADAQVDVGAGLAAQLGGHVHQLANALLVQTGEGILLVDLLVVVGAQELAGVVTAEAEGHLGQVVGAKGEELCLLGDLVGGDGRPGDLDHGAHMVLHGDAGLGDDLVGGLHHHVLDELQFLDLAHQGDHDLGLHLPVGVGLLDVDSGLDDGAGLHGGDLRVGDSQTAAAVAHHGVELVEGGDDGLQLLHSHVHLLGQGDNVLLGGGQELVERGIQEADGDGLALHGLVQALEVGALHGQQLGQGLLPLLHSLGDDHLPHGGDAVGVEEHVLGAAEADALGAELGGLLGVTGGVGVGADAQGAVLVGPGHQAAEVAGDGGGNGGDGLGVDVAGGAVQGDVVAPLDGLAGHLEPALFLVHLDLAAAGDAAGAHATGHNGGVGGHAATDGEDALGNVHAVDVGR